MSWFMALGGSMQLLIPHHTVQVQLALIYYDLNIGSLRLFAHNFHTFLGSWSLAFKFSVKVGLSKLRQYSGWNLTSAVGPVQTALPWRHRWWHRWQTAQKLTLPSRISWKSGEWSQRWLLYMGVNWSPKACCNPEFWNPSLKGWKSMWVLIGFKIIWPWRQTNAGLQVFRFETLLKSSSTSFFFLMHYL